MKIIRCISGFVACLLLSCPLSIAQEAASVSGEASIGYREVEDERQSAKFQEYRDLKDGTFGDMEIGYRGVNGYFLDLKGYNISLDDQFISLRNGRYGLYTLTLSYNQIPHRFAFDAKTIYAGSGSGTLVLSNLVQRGLQNVETDPISDLTGDAVVDGRDRTIELANRTQEVFTGAFSTDIQLLRKIAKVGLDVSAFDPIRVSVELKNEQRKGTRPFSGSFGFGNTIEIPEPINYDTSTAKVTAEFARKPFYISASYYLSVFENHIDTLTWDNPFREIDSSSASAYTTPTAGTAANAFTFANVGPSKGLIDLVPNNHYHNVSTTAAISLPMRSRLSATASWGWMRQDDALKAFTTNTAIVSPFRAIDPTTGDTVGNVDANVDTQLYEATITSRPLNFMHIRGRYRFYEYDNKSKIIEFPDGYVRADATVQAGAVENEPTGFEKQTASVDVGFDLLPRSTVTLGYTLEKVEREHREVADQDEDIYRIAFDSRIIPWMTINASYERSERDIDNYDFALPFGGAVPNAQLPFLRKYDEVGRDRDKVQVTATVNPLDPLTLSATVKYWQDDYKADFGLLNDEHQMYGLDADYSLTEMIKLSAFYSFELVEDNQLARQWNPGTTGIGDPYLVETGLLSNSNWEAKKKDKTHSAGGGLRLGVPRAFDVGVDYTYSHTDGEIALSSPVGTGGTAQPPANDANPFVAAGFTQVDDITTHTLNASGRYFFTPNMSLTLGYLWERYDIDDFSSTGFTFVPTTTTGTFNGGILMGILPEDYNASMVYAKVSYVF